MLDLPASGPHGGATKAGRREGGGVYHMKKDPYKTKSNLDQCAQKVPSALSAKSYFVTVLTTSGDDMGKMIHWASSRANHSFIKSSRCL